MNERIHKSMKDFEAARRRVENSQLCEENKRAIIEFANARLAKGSSRLRVVKCSYCLRFLAEWLKKPFAEATKRPQLTCRRARRQRLCRMHHLKEKDEEETKIQLKKCHRCKQSNSPVSKFCNSCGAVLNLETVYEVENERKNADELMNRLMSDPEFKRIVLERIVNGQLEDKLA